MARELWQTNALSLQFWCLSNTLILRVCALEASKSHGACIILSLFTCKNPQLLIYNCFLLPKHQVVLGVPDTIVLKMMLIGLLHNDTFYSPDHQVVLGVPNTTILTTMLIGSLHNDAFYSTNHEVAFIPASLTGPTLPVEYPSCLQTTVAALSSQESWQTVPHWSWAYTSTRPCGGLLDPVEPISRTAKTKKWWVCSELH